VQKNQSYGSPAWWATCTSGLAWKSEDITLSVGGRYRGSLWQLRDSRQCFATFCRKFASEQGQYNWQQSNWTAKLLDARSRHCRRPGFHSWRLYRITFPAHDIGFDQPYGTVQQTVVGVLQFRTCYYHVAEITRIYLVWTKILQDVRSAPLTRVLQGKISYKWHLLCTDVLISP